MLCRVGRRTRPRAGRSREAKAEASAHHDAKHRFSLAQISVLVGILGTVVTTAFLIADRVGKHVPEALAAELANVRATPSVTLHDHPHALELLREGVPPNVIQRQPGNRNLGVTSIYLQGIDPDESSRASKLAGHR